MSPVNNSTETAQEVTPRATAPAGADPAGQSPVPPIPPALDRRKDVRRKSRPLPRTPIFNRVEESRRWIPRSWSYVVLCMIAVATFPIAITGVVPPLDVLMALMVSVALASSIRWVHDRILGGSEKLRAAGVALVVVVPMYLFGMGITRWAISGGIPWDAALAALLTVGCLASAYLRRHPGVIFASQLALWLSAVLTTASVPAMFALAVAAIQAILVSREQLSEQRMLEEQLQARERMQTRARDILADYEETRQGWFWETDRRSQLTYISAPAAKTLGSTPDKLIGSPLAGLFDLAHTGQEGERTLMFHLSVRSAFQELPVRAAVDGEERWWSVSGRPVYDDFDNFVGFRGSGTDLTEKKRSQEHASRLAHYDSLTGLANRFQMSQTLEKILTARQDHHRACSVMLLDLDRFKQVNDTMGHPAGDALLKQVAQRLKRSVGKMGQVGRLGGDEFEVILPGRVKRTALVDLAQDIIHSLSQPYSIDGQRVIIGASVGIAISPEDGSTSDELIRNVDLALYAAKDGGRGRYHFYAEDLHAEAEEKAQLEQDLRDAVVHRQFELYYQPFVSMQSETICGFEALLRWFHPEKGWIPPSRFVAIAEESGLIDEIGEWALRTACQDLARWPEDVRVAVNVSARQFANPQLPSVVSSAIRRAGVDPGRVELEITESVFLSDDEGTDAMFAALKRVGVRLALDDFGTGYSSLGYLKKAPFDKIKIDQSFVRGATEADSRNGAIIASITSLAHSLGMDTTAEGVETLDELDLVRMHGCSHVQGFIYERPIRAEDATQRLLTGLTAVAQGPRSTRAPRQTMLRKVVLDHQGTFYNGTIRNISLTGAQIEGLWNVPVGTIFQLHVSDGVVVTATARWSEEDRLGVEFAAPLKHDQSGRISAVQGRAPQPVAASGGAR